MIIDEPYIHSLISRCLTDDPFCTCCLPCHFSYEEKYCFPYLPLDLQKKIKAEHEALEERGYPLDQVMSHSDQEMIYFRHYLPDRLVKRLDADHLDYAIKHKIPIQLGAYLVTADRECGSTCDIQQMGNYKLKESVEFPEILD